MPVFTLAPRTYDELNQEVENNQGVLTISMMNLRQIHGNKRLGPHVNAAISRTLQKLGLKHYPTPLTNSENHKVRIYRRGVRWTRLSKRL